MYTCDKGLSCSVYAGRVMIVDDVCIVCCDCWMMIDSNRFPMYSVPQYIIPRDVIQEDHALLMC